MPPLHSVDRDVIRGSKIPRGSVRFEENITTEVKGQPGAVWVCLPDFRQRESSYDAVQLHLVALGDLPALQFLDKMRRLTYRLCWVGRLCQDTTVGLFLDVLVETVLLQRLSNPAVLKVPAPSVRLLLCLVANSRVRPLPLLLCGHEGTLPGILIQGIK